MGNWDRAKLTASRLRSENPYAHIELLEEYEPSELQSTLGVVIRNAAWAEPDIARRAIWTFEAIENQAREVHKSLWSRRDALWGRGSDVSPVTLLDPAKVCELYEYEFELVDSLGVYTDRRERVAVAGQINRTQRRVLISRDFDPESQLFTAAHEIGHLILHPHVDRLHRDRAISGAGVRRDRIELEADKFAVYFLMPKRLVLEEFRARFLVLKYQLDEAAAFALGPEKCTKAFGGRRELARVLASAIGYNGKNFHSLASHFGVTTETMAIRLEELQIV